MKKCKTFGSEIKCHSIVDCSMQAREIQGGPKEAPYFVFHLKLVFQNFFQFFPGGVESRPGKFF